VRRFEAKRVLVAIILAAIAARLACALYMGDQVEALPGVADQISYHTLSVRVLQGHGFSFGQGWWPATPAGQPTAHWSYLYVLFLAGVYSVFGPHPLAARIVQAVVVGLLQPLLTWRIATRLFGARVGLVSAALAAIYSYFVYYGGALMTESFYIVAMLWVVDIVTMLSDSSARGKSPLGLGNWLWLGAALGCASLLRQITLLLAPAVILWAAYRVASERKKMATSRESRGTPVLARATGAAVVLAVCIVPWTARNYAAFGQLVILNTNAGFAFYWGNHPIHGSSFKPLLPASGPGYGSLIPEELRGLNEAAMDRALLARGLGFVREDPVRYTMLSLGRVVEYFKFWPTAASGAMSNSMRLLSFGVCLPFILSGVLLAALRPAVADGRSSRPEAALLIGLVAAYSAFYLLTWTLIRYRLPADALLMPFAAFSMVRTCGYLANATRGFTLLTRRLAA